LLKVRSEQKNLMDSGIECGAKPIQIQQLRRGLL
jgi:hypothetical protein